MRIFLVFYCAMNLASISLAADVAKGKKKNLRTPAQIACAADPEEIASQVNAMTSCYDANTVVNQCTYGSRADGLIVGSAIEVCAKDYRKITAADENVLKDLMGRCQKKYGGKAGSLYTSMMMFCKLKVANLFSDLYEPVD